MEYTAQHEAYRALSTQEAATRARTNREFADMGYRVNMMERYAESLNARHAIVFDDITSGVPEEQQDLLHGLPGYERALFPGLWHAAGFPEGATTIVSAPPAHAEMQLLKGMHAQMREQTGKEINYRVVYEDPQSGELIDLMHVDEIDYPALCERYATLTDNIGFISGISKCHHLEVIRRHSDQLLGDTTSAILPFQLQEYHKTELAEYAEQVRYHDIPIMDKALNSALLTKQGLGQYVPEMTVVFNDGSRNGHYDELVRRMEKIEEIDATDENLDVFTDSIVAAIDELAERGKPAYVKLDSKGVSGLGNIDYRDEDYNRIYNPAINRAERAALIKQLFRDRQMKKIPVSAVVEERIPEEDLLDDYGVGGFMVDGEFFPTGICPFATDKGVYTRLWMAPQAEQLGEDPAEWERMMDITGQAGSVLAKGTGFENGVFSVDMFRTRSGRMLIHDYNLRRGGRSTPEFLISMMQQPVMEAQIEVTTEEVGLPTNVNNTQLVDTYQTTVARLAASGAVPFATAFGYFGLSQDNGQRSFDHPDFMKFKLVVPMHALGLDTVPRAQQMGHLKQVVVNTAR